MSTATIAASPSIRRSRPTKLQPLTSVVLPIFNEAEHLRDIVAKVVKHARSRPHREFVFVDDGSSDGTGELLRQLLPAGRHENVRYLAYGDNRGKGYAVLHGFRHARGRNLVFTDGDLAYSLDHIDQLEQALLTHDVVIGSRQLVEAEGVNARPLMRTLLGEAFNRLTRMIASLPFADTQAGLKAFRRDVALYIAERQRSFRYSIDVEMLFIARRRGWTIAEIPAVVSCDHASKASRVDLLRDPLKMLRDLVKIRVNGLLGRYD